MLNDALLSLRLARRDWRAGELRLLLVSLVVAVAAIASVGFFVDRMRVALEQEAAQLLGADLILGADEPLDESFARQAQSLGLRIAHSAIFPSMAVAGGAMPELAAVKAVSADYPLRGHIRLQGPGGGAGEDIEAARAPTGAELWLDPQLARRLAVTLGDTVQFGQQTLEVLHTPGHTPGHIVFFHRPLQVAIVGDVLFQGSIGRTDFPRGDHATLIASIVNKLWPLGDDVTFVPGHGPTSTFGQERRTNPFVADAVLGR